MIASFPPDLEQFMTREIAAGNYGSEQELLVDAVRTLRDNQARFHRFRDDLQTELARIDRGEGTVIEGDDELTAFFAQLKNEALAELAAEKAEKQ
jgi:Arc/MetJ-type ribon-helix-helix transcriptional regulator